MSRKDWQYMFKKKSAQTIYFISFRNSFIQLKELVVRICVVVIIIIIRCGLLC